MTLREFTRAVVRRRWTGAAIFAVCVLGGLLLGLTSRPLYQATALFQVQQLVDLGSDPRGWNVGHATGPRLNADVLEKWLDQKEVLRRVIDLAGERGQITAAQLHGHDSVIPAGDGGLFEATVWDPSAERAQRLADALAGVLGDLAVDIVQQARQAVIDQIQRAMAEAGRLREGGAEATSAVPFDSILGARRSALVRHDAALALYTHLETQLLALELAQRTGGTPARIVQKAGRPVAPVTPGWALYAQFGVVSGVLLGLAGIFVKDAVDGPGV